MSFIDRTTARHLGYVLKIFLGLEAAIKLVLMAYGTVIADSEIPINPHKAMFDKSPSRCRQPWPGRSHDMWRRGFCIVVDSSRDRGLVSSRIKLYIFLTSSQGHPDGVWNHTHGSSAL